MPAVFAPGVARAAMWGMIGANPWESAIYWADEGVTAPWTTPFLQALADSIWARWPTAFSTVCANNVSLTHVDVLDIGSSTGLFATHTGTPIVGGETHPLMPSSQCTVYQLQILQRYRGGHPRVSLPIGTNNDMMDEANWTASYVTNQTTAFKTFITNITTDMITAGLAAPIQVVPRYTYTYTNDPVHHKYLKERSSFIGPVKVINWKVRQKVGTQRRRLTP